MDEQKKEAGVWESHLAGRLGVGRKALVQARLELLEEGRDWRMDGRRVILTAEAVQRLLERFGVKGAVLTPSAAEKGREPNVAAQPDPVMEEVVKVVRTDFPNRRLIQGRRENGEVVWVRVRDSGNYAAAQWNGRPMRVRVRFSPAEPGAVKWLAVGRPPRARGQY